MKKVSVIFPEDTKKWLGLHCNNKTEDYATLGETKEIEKYLQRTPKVALDVGAGLGRASVFFFIALGWEDTMFILADGDSGSVQFAGMRAGKAEFYNSLKATESYCQANGLQKFKTFNLEQLAWDKLPRKPDLVYSFKALGFHWPLNSFLEDVYPALAKKCRLIFELRAGNAVCLKWTEKQIAAIDRGKYNIAGLFLEADRKGNNFIVLERQ